MIIFHCLIANEQKYDERKVIIEIIKNNYDQWSVKEMEDESLENINEASPITLHKNEETQPQEVNEKFTDKNRFSNFTFKILKSQAVVKFYVDNKLISAFFEKKDGRWQLVCAADITPML
jgi:hypothetical protein